ncbi:DinB family protein [Alicyclobacillus dauci]|uniref:DinB family protein n=1 Tax=Alicyclobacillus dauci TaxID=1475485 RepID=A0ABY6Z0U5_9BACL|nr:DinB family protein [Alicyclobacillus dauci]WAH36436.1 DinB family protein [Alicyclobacillus dauci]
MLKEVSDHFEVLTLVHQTIDNMIEGLSQDQWLYRPNGTFNNIASIIDHTARVEKKFISAISGEPLDIDTQAPFKESQWDVPTIQKAWVDTLPYTRDVLERLTESDLDKPGLSLRVGELNRRQLIVFTISHTTHHRGQIPLVMKLFQG